jgi:hypothetical protein
VRRFRARDLSGQKQGRFEAPVKIRIGDYTGTVRERLGLPSKDQKGNGLSYRWRNDSQGKILLESDPIGRVVEEDEQVILMGEPVAG